MHLDTESDAWQARSSLVVTDTGGDDIAMPDDVRVYLASGVQHAAPRPMAKQVTQLPGNPLGYGAFMRSLLIALVEWVEHDVPRPIAAFRRAQQARWYRWPRHASDFPCCQA